MIKIVLADDHKLFREGLRKLLETEPDIKIVGEASDGDEALNLVQQTQPDVLLFETNMPHMNGICLAQELNALRIKLDIKIAEIVVSTSSDENVLATLSAEGVQGFVLKSSGCTELLSAIRTVCEGDSYIDPRVAGKLMTSFAKRRSEMDLLSALSPREKVVLYWLAQGLNNLEIAQKIVLSEKTVKNHVSHMLRKLELRDRTQAAIAAWKLGFAQMSPETLEIFIR